MKTQSKSQLVWWWTLGVLVFVGLDTLGEIDHRWAAYAGAAFGLIGGSVGAYYGIKRTNSAAERALMTRFCLLLLLLTGLFVIGFLLIPGYYRFLVFIPVGLGCFALVRYTNGRRAEIQAGQQDRSPAASP